MDKTTWESTGGAFADVRIPPLKIQPGELVAFAVDWPYGDIWFEFMSLIAGHRSSSFIHVVGSAALLMPDRLGFSPEDESSTVGEFTERVLQSSRKSFALDELSISPNQLVGQSRMTDRLLLQVAAALVREPSLLVLSTSGLDPLGIKKTASFAKRLLPNGVLIDVIASSLSTDYDSVATVDRMVHMSGAP